MMRNNVEMIRCIYDGNTALDPGYMPHGRHAVGERSDSSVRQQRKVHLYRDIGLCPDNLTGEEENEPDDPEISNRILRLVGLKGMEEESAELVDQTIDPTVCEEDSDVYGAIKVPRLILAGALGLLEQVCLFFLLGLQVKLIPAVTLVFLWFLFFVITAGFMEEVGILMKKKEKGYGRDDDRIQYRRKCREKIRRSCF